MQANLTSQSSELYLDELEGPPNSEKESTTLGTAGATMPTQDWTVEETAKVLGLSRGAVIRRLEDGILPGYRVKRGATSAWRVKAIWQEANQIKEELQKPKASTLDSGNEEHNLLSFDPATVEILDKTESIPRTEGISDRTDLLSEELGKAMQEQVETDASESADKHHEMLEVYEADEETESSAAIPLTTYKELIELRTKLSLTEMQFQETKEKLETANHKIGYLEARIDFGQEQLKLLTDSKQTQPWWTRIFAPFVANRQV